MIGKTRANVYIDIYYLFIYYFILFIYLHVCVYYLSLSTSPSQRVQLHIIFIYILFHIASEVRVLEK